MSTVLVLLTLFGVQSVPLDTPGPKLDLSPAHFDKGGSESRPWWVRDYMRYSDGDGYSSFQPLAGKAEFAVKLHRLPDWWPLKPTRESTARTVQEGIGFGMVLLLMILVPLGSTIVFLRPRRVSWWPGSQRLSRAEARAMLESLGQA